MAVRLIASAAIAFLTATNLAVAEDQFSEPPYGASAEEIDAARKDCGTSQQAMNICAWVTYQDSELALRAAEEELAGELSPDSRLTAFRKAEETFAQFRNATCNFEVDQEIPGSMGFSIIYYCRKSYNDRRATAISQYLECLSGKQSCEVPFSLFGFEKQR